MVYPICFWWIKFITGTEPEPEVELPVSATIPSNLPLFGGLGGYNAADGFTGSVAQDGDTFKVTGTFTKQDTANEYLKFPEGQDTGYYLPIEFTGEQNHVIKRESNDKKITIGDTGDGYNKAILILYVDQSQPKINFKEYADMSDAESDLNGTSFVVDCSECSFNLN